MLRSVILQGVRRTAVTAIPGHRCLLHASHHCRVIQTGSLSHRRTRSFHTSNHLASDIEERVKNIIGERLGVKQVRIPKMSAESEKQ